LIDPGYAMSYRVPVAAVGRYSEFKSRSRVAPGIAPWGSHRSGRARQGIRLFIS
jgi:hypothetical protein